MSDYSAILKKYVINNGTYVDKKMEPLANKEELNKFKTTWMFPGLRVTVIEDEDGEMRDYRCKIVDGEKVWVPIAEITEIKIVEEVNTLKETSVVLEDKVESLENIFNIQGNDKE